MSWLTCWSLRNRSIEYPAITMFTVQSGAAPADVERGVRFRRRPEHPPLA